MDRKYALAHLLKLPPDSSGDGTVLALLMLICVPQTVCAKMVFHMPAPHHVITAYQ